MANAGVRRQQQRRRAPGHRRSLAGRNFVKTSQDAPITGTIARRVLIVEDDLPTASSLSSILGHAGYDTRVYSSGQTALRSTDSVRPDAALVDIHLPDLSGLVLTQKLREKLGPDVPIIVVSGDTSMETLNSLPYVGATYFLSKPTSGPIVLEKLSQCLGTTTRDET
jgi:DNA-binding response OmpR family regulator